MAEYSLWKKQDSGKSATSIRPIRNQSSSRLHICRNQSSAATAAAVVVSDDEGMGLGFRGRGTSNNQRFGGAGKDRQFRGSISPASLFLTAGISENVSRSTGGLRGCVTNFKNEAGGNVLPVGGENGICVAEVGKKASRLSKRFDGNAGMDGFTFAFGKKMAVALMLALLALSCFSTGAAAMDQPRVMEKNTASDTNQDPTKDIGSLQSFDEHRSLNEDDDAAVNYQEELQLQQEPLSEVQSLVPHMYLVMRGKEMTTAGTSNSNLRFSSPNSDSKIIVKSKHDVSQVDVDHGSQIKKREVDEDANWGSNPYLLGKRAKFWIARGKKDEDRVAQAESPDYVNELSLSHGDDVPYEEDSINYAFPYMFTVAPKYTAFDLTQDSHTRSPNSRVYFSKDNLNYNERPTVGVTGKRKDGLFWTSRGKRQESGAVVSSQEMDFSLPSSKRGKVIKLPPLVKEPIIYGKNGDNSKFWMTRGRRFWAARGKKASVDSATFNRLERLVGSPLKGNTVYTLASPPDELKNERMAFSRNAGIDEPQNDMRFVDQPNFWIVRGKKYAKPEERESETLSYYPDLDEDLNIGLLTPYEASRTKKGFNRFTALARLNNRDFNRTPNFWASRGRKNFWAARGKRSENEVIHN